MRISAMLSTIWFVALVAPVSVWRLAIAAENVEEVPDKVNRTIWDDIIPAREDIKKPPTLDGKPVIVNTAISVFSLRTKEDDMQIIVEMYINVEWKDYRLRYPNTTNSSLIIPNSYKRTIWVPSLYFYNEQDAKEMLLKVPHKISYLKDTLSYKMRYTAKISCEFIYYDFPMDTQECFIQLQSFHEKTSEVVLKYKNQAHFPSDKFPSQFIIDKDNDVYQPKMPRHCVEIVDDEERSCVKLKIQMERSTGFHTVQMFVPSILIVIVSWVSFWINIETVPARVGLGITSMLTLVTQFSKDHSNLPPVSYVKAIDIWMVFCLIMVFCSIMEFAFSYCLHYHRKAEAAKKPKRPRQIHPVEGGRQKTATAQVEEEPEIITASFSFDKHQKVDKVSRVLFPVVFLLFIIIFWSKYGPDKDRVD